MEGTGNDLLLLFTGKLAEVDSITGNTDGQVRICFGVLVRLEQSLTIHDVDIEVMRTVLKIAVHDGDQIGNAILIRLTQCIWHNGEGIGNTVTASGIGQLGYGIQGRQRTTALAVMHGISTGGEGLALLAAVGRGAGLLTVNHV